MSTTFADPTDLTAVVAALAARVTELEAGQEALDRGLVDLGTDQDRRVTGLERAVQSLTAEADAVQQVMRAAVHRAGLDEGPVRPVLTLVRADGAS